MLASPDFGSIEAETLIQGCVHLFRLAEKTKHFRAPKVDPNSDSSIDFRLKTTSELIQVYLGNIQRLCQRVEVFA
jgi:hypothetical protein